MCAALAKSVVTMRIPDLDTGYRILSRLPLANSEQAERDIGQFLDSLLHAPPTAEVYLQLLEQTRISLCFIEDALARRFADRALPLGEAEEKAFHQVVATWRKVTHSYAHCAQLFTPDDSEAYQAKLALILHRCIYYTGMAIIEHHRARRQVAAGLWLDLHGYYASAEEWNVASLPVPDALDPLGRSTHCTAAYVSVLLLDVAHPQVLCFAEVNLIRRWANNWSALAELHPIDSRQPPMHFVVDLMQDCSLQVPSEDGRLENARRLDTSRLIVQINELRSQLRKGITPVQLALGDDCTAVECHRLLKRLSRFWLLMQVPSKYRRQKASGATKVCTGFAGIHYCLSGKGFAQPESASVYSRKEFEALFAFRHQLDPGQQFSANHHAQIGFAIDRWDVLDQCANGYRLLRSSAGRRIEAGQLLAVSPPESNMYLLAHVVWVMQEEEGGLTAGIATMPGKPEAIAARLLPHVSGQENPYSRAFVLPSVPTVGVDRTLILPKGWYSPERLVEVYVNGSWRVKMLRLVGDGADFDRVTFLIV